MGEWALPVQGSGASGGGVTGSKLRQAPIESGSTPNNVHFNQAREKLERWADDMVLAAEKALRDTKEGIKALRRDARQATTVDAQHEIQRRIQELEKRQRKQRQEIFNVEDEIMQKRDGLIESLERRLSQKTSSEPLFNVRWAVV